MTIPSPTVRTFDRRFQPALLRSVARLTQRSPLFHESSPSAWLGLSCRRSCRRGARSAYDSGQVLGHFSHRLRLWVGSVDNVSTLNKKSCFVGKTRSNIMQYDTSAPPNKTNVVHTPSSQRFLKRPYAPNVLHICPIANACRCFVLFGLSLSLLYSNLEKTNVGKTTPCGCLVGVSTCYLELTCLLSTMHLGYIQSNCMLRKMHSTIYILAQSS